MSLKKLIVSGAAALALVGTASIAADGNPPVQIGCDGTGDYLLAPVYYAVANWKTELKVVNTNTTRAIVAKVVVRDSKESEEIMDFAIYLTPGDVWTGTLYDDNGVVKLTSTDDSMIINGQVASPTNPITVGIHPLRENKENGMYHNENWHGYVEIFGMVSYDPDLIKRHAHPGATHWKVCEPLDKLDFYNAVKGEGKDLVDDYNASDVANSDLMGKEILFAEDNNVNGRRYMALNMMALENFSLDPVFTNARGGNTKLQNMSSKKLGVLPEYDAAIAKSRIMVMYEGDGNQVYPIRTHFTVPTKKYWFDIDNMNMPNGYFYEDVYANDPLGGNTAATTQGSEYYYVLNDGGDKIVARDNSENCKKCREEGEVSGQGGKECKIKIHEEVHFFEYTNTNPADLYDASNPYKELLQASGGWVDFNLSGIAYESKVLNTQEKLTKRVKFNGMPIVPTTFYAKDVQGIYLNNWLYNQYEKAKAEFPTDEYED